MDPRCAVEALVAMSFWQDRVAFVTGGTGLLGSWVVNELQTRGAQVVVLVRDDVRRSLMWRVADLDRLTIIHGAFEEDGLVARVLNEYEVETVFHLGAQTIVQTANRSPLSTFESNIKGTWQVLEAARVTSGIGAVLVASSDKAYGSHDVLPYSESAPLQGRHPYDVSKSCTDLISFSYYETYGTPICVTRCGNLYGPGDLNYNRLIPGTIRSLERDEPIIIRSDGTAIRDYLFVKDAAFAYIDLAEEMITNDLAGEAFNFSNELQLSVLDVVNKLIELMNVNTEPQIMDTARGEIKFQYLSAAKAREMLNWKPSFDFDQGLRETIAWYRSELARA